LDENLTADPPQTPTIQTNGLPKIKFTNATHFTLSFRHLNSLQKIHVHQYLSEISACQLKRPQLQLLSRYVSRIELFKNTSSGYTTTIQLSFDSRSTAYRPSQGQ